MMGRTHPGGLHRRWLALLAVLLILLGGAAGFLFAGDDLATLLGRDATWAEMMRSKDFRVGLDPSFPPFEALDADGAPHGFDVDLAHALASEWGIVAKINPIGFDSLVDALRASRIDAVISAMPFDERLTRDVTFSTAYFDAGIRLAVRAGSPIIGAANLAGKRVAVEWGSTGDMVARRLQRGGEGGAVAALDFEIVQFDTPDAVLAALQADAALDAALVDQVTLRLAQGRGAEIVAVGEVFESSPYVIISPRKAGTLAAEINAALAKFASNGTLATLEDKWFGDQKGTTP